VASFPDGVARALAEYASEEPLPAPESGPPTLPVLAAPPAPVAPVPGQLGFKIGDICPECGEASLVNEEGCRKCYSCGFSQC
jgi:ribonucleoside-diphosphate reductase alpha chain